MADYNGLRTEYLRQSDEFTELNKQYNRAVRADQMTDELELKFLKAERKLKESYRAMQDVKATEVAEGKHKPKKDKDK